MVTQLPLDGVPLVKTGPSGVTIRLAREDEVETLRQIERSAAQAFRLIEAFSWLSVGEVQGADMHFALIEAGTNWVAVDGDDHPLGFLSAEIAGRQLHICEISVDHLHQGFGLGRKLIDYAVDAATRLGLAMTRASAVNDHPRFIEALAESVEAVLTRYAGGIPLSIVPSP